MANKDVYGFNANYSGVELLSAKEMELVVSNSNTSGTSFLIQNVSLNYQQPIQTIRELGSADAYYIGQPPVGNLSIERIVGSEKITKLLGAFGSGLWTIPSSGSSTSTNNRIVTIKPLKGMTGTSYKMFGCIVTTFGNTMNANSSLVQDSIQIMFGSLEII